MTAEQLRKQEYEKTRKFTRYLYIRYYTAVVFFANLYLTMALKMRPVYLMTMPILVILIAFGGFFNLLRIQKDPTSDANVLDVFFKINIGVTLVEIILIWINGNYYFPFIADTMSSQVFWSIVYLCSALISFACVWHISRIKKESDTISKQLKSLKDYKI